MNAATQTLARVAVIGDVGGHFGDLRTELIRLGADPTTGALPSTLTIVQVGDLVHRGPESDRVIRLVDHYLTHQPGQWIQLIGNHEAHYVRPRTFQWEEELSVASVHALRRWWREGSMQVATVIPSAGRDVLVTHAGVTRLFWEQDLASPSTARAAADLLNAMGRAGEPAVFRPGEMLLGGPPDLTAGPLWAAAGSELVPSWMGFPMPFSQVHGHSSCYHRWHQTFWAEEAVSAVTELDHEAGHEITQLDRGVIIGVDPGHKSVAHSSWRSWESEGLGV